MLLFCAASKSVFVCSWWVDGSEKKNDNLDLCHNFPLESPKVSITLSHFEIMHLSWVGELSHSINQPIDTIWHIFPDDSYSMLS